MAAKRKSESGPVNVRINTASIKQILDKLDHAQPLDQLTDQRADERFRYRGTCLIKLKQLGGATVTLKAPTRDLSRSGLAFLHHGFVHAGASCCVLLVSSNRTPIQVEADIVRCEYLEGGIHVVSLKFRKQIDISILCDSAVSRRVLVVDDDPQMRKLLHLLLADQNIQLIDADSGEAAMEAVKSHLFDMILMDVDMPGTGGLAAVKQLRDSGYTGSVTAVTSMNGDGDEERLRKEGFNHYLPKPVNKESLLQLLAQVEDAPLLSTLAQVDGMQEMIAHFVDELGKLTYEIQSALAQKNMSELCRLSRTLKGKAGSFGFNPISEAARNLETKALAAGETAEVCETVGQLVKLCRLARKPN